MTPALTITDPRFSPSAHRSLIDRIALRLIRDERDLPFIHLSLAMTSVLLPGALYLFMNPSFSWWIGALYSVVNLAFFFDRYILMLHNTSHRPLFRREVGRFRTDWLNHYIPWVLGPLAGETPETYYAHHIGMHHAEENLAPDLSSTMGYQRDSLLGFARYWARFFFAGLFELSAYHRQQNNLQMRNRLLRGELSWYVATTGLMFVNWRATLVVLVFPFLFARLTMMMGNWAQHAFIDPKDPANPYKSSITCINTRYNRRCFNDGYHIGHHELAARHWTDMPADFEAKRARYIEHDAIVFSGIDYFVIWLFLMLKRYDWLANHFVELRDQPRTHQEIIALLKSRTARI